MVEDNCGVVSMHLKDVFKDELAHKILVFTVNAQNQFIDMHAQD